MHRLAQAVVSSGSNGTQERQRHSGSLSSLGSVSVTSMAGGLRVSVLGVQKVGGSSKSAVAT